MGGDRSIKIVTTDPNSITARARTAARRIMTEPLLHTVTSLPGTQTGMNAHQEDHYARIIADEFTSITKSDDGRQ